MSHSALRFQRVLGNTWLWLVLAGASQVACVHPVAMHGGPGPQAVEVHSYPAPQVVHVHSQYVTPAHRYPQGAPFHARPSGQMISSVQLAPQWIGDRPAAPQQHNRGDAAPHSRGNAGQPQRAEVTPRPERKLWKGQTNERRAFP